MKSTALKLAAMLAWSLSGFNTVLTAAPAVRPNIVVLLCDDLGYGDLGCFGHSEILTPHLDRLASEGVKFTHCYSSAPVCSPSRAGLMTGRNPNRLGIRDWIPNASGIFLRPGEVTVAGLLKQAGYRTCHVGKWHLNSRVDGSEPTPGDAGFEHWLYTQNNAGPSHLHPSNFIRNGKPAGRMEGPSSHVLAGEAIQWLDQVKDQPFFLNVWFHETHEPVAAADEYLALYPKEKNLSRRHYLGDVSQMDAAVGRLMAYLDRRGLRENTFVFFSSDNGPETLNRYKGAARSHGSPGRLRGMKLHVTEAGYRVPGIIRWPGHGKPGSVSTEPVCGVDLLPTVCEIAGIKAPADRPLDGASMLPALDGGTIRRPHPLYWQYDASISRPWVISLRDGPWKLLGDAGLEKLQLYHIIDDQEESRDLSGQEPGRVSSMAATARRLRDEIAAEGAKSGNPVIHNPP